MSWLVGHASSEWEVAAKAALMYVTALLALRVGERRTLAQWTIIDFATAVAMGAIIGRTAIAGTQSYLTGAVAVCTLVVIHRVASLLRLRPALGKLFDHRIRVLVADGQLRPRELHRCGLTDGDLFTQLRQRGVFAIDDVRYVLYEPKGTITVIGRDVPAHPTPELVRDGLEHAAGYSRDVAGPSSRHASSERAVAERSGDHACRS
jgi:uncharacterized membrane protein YcaP (DUF421 family)